ncbi:WhiB-like iron-sulfur binding domain containing protein [uncultured Caudovirales phage]|uniref:WhiB-like iron-sulfur binding domain containing protein n=1 Tax=uncultured Caudovirales phage TaxID=2100421 RepID=A0A6J5SVQ0_9CAUD|nr:WhiB-like iron-sulfur binding domain containing protein [uncultured Caudovirales phage]
MDRLEVPNVSAPYPQFDGSQLCAQTDPEVFFPTQESDRSHVEQAKAICARCHFANPCLDWAVARSIVGIWAGTNPRERVKIARERGITQLHITDQLTA